MPPKRSLEDINAEYGAKEDEWVAQRKVLLQELKAVEHEIHRASEVKHALAIQQAVERMRREKWSAHSEAEAAKVREELEAVQQRQTEVAAASISLSTAVADAAWDVVDATTTADEMEDSITAAKMQNENARLAASGLIYVQEAPSSLQHRSKRATTPSRRSTPANFERSCLGAVERDDARRPSPDTRRVSPEAHGRRTTTTLHDRSMLSTPSTTLYQRTPMEHQMLPPASTSSPSPDPTFRSHDLSLTLHPLVTAYDSIDPGASGTIGSGSPTSVRRAAAAEIERLAQSIAVHASREAAVNAELALATTQLDVLRRSCARVLTLTPFATSASNRHAFSLVCPLPYTSSAVEVGDVIDAATCGADEASCSRRFWDRVHERTAAIAAELADRHGFITTAFGPSPAVGWQPKAPADWIDRFVDGLQALDREGGPRESATTNNGSAVKSPLTSDRHIAIAPHIILVVARLRGGFALGDDPVVEVCNPAATAAPMADVSADSPRRDATAAVLSQWRSRQTDAERDVLRRSHPTTTTLRLSELYYHCIASHVANPNVVLLLDLYAADQRRIIDDDDTVVAAPTDAAANHQQRVSPCVSIVATTRDPLEPLTWLHMRREQEPPSLPLLDVLMDWLTGVAPSTTPECSTPQLVQHLRTALGGAPPAPGQSVGDALRLQSKLPTQLGPRRPRLVVAAPSDVGLRLNKGSAEAQEPGPTVIIVPRPGDLQRIVELNLAGANSNAITTVARRRPVSWMRSVTQLISSSSSSDSVIVDAVISYDACMWTRWAHTTAAHVKEQTLLASRTATTAVNTDHWGQTVAATLAADVPIAERRVSSLISALGCGSLYPQQQQPSEREEALRSAKAVLHSTSAHGEYVTFEAVISVSGSSHQQQQAADAANVSVVTGQNDEGDSSVAGESVAASSVASWRLPQAADITRLLFADVVDRCLVDSHPAFDESRGASPRRWRSAPVLAAECVFDVNVQPLDATELSATDDDGNARYRVRASFDGLVTFLYFIAGLVQHGADDAPFRLNVESGAVNIPTELRWPASASRDDVEAALRKLHSFSGGGWLTPPDTNFLRLQRYTLRPSCSSAPPVVDVTLRPTRDCMIHFGLPANTARATRRLCRETLGATQLAEQLHVLWLVTPTLQRHAASPIPTLVDAHVAASVRRAAAQLQRQLAVGGVALGRCTGVRIGVLVMNGTNAEAEDVSGPQRPAVSTRHPALPPSLSALSDAIATAGSGALTPTEAAPFSCSVHLLAHVADVDDDGLTRSRGTIKAIELSTLPPLGSGWLGAADALLRECAGDPLR
jgi:hypothetical protein